MIFVTVGTHEQQFNRPKKASYHKFYPYKTMIQMVDKAWIVITHGGPSSFIMPLQVGKILIVVPRRHEFYEHVNDHQVDFCRKVSERQGNIIVVEDVQKLGETLENYDKIVGYMKNGLTSNNERCCKEFGKIVDEMVR